VEQIKTLLSDIFKSLWISALCLFILSGCKKAEEHPENLDPIYADLVAQAAGIQAKVDGQKKKVEELQGKLAKMGPRDPETKGANREIENLERGLVLMQQDAQYFTIRAEQRRLYDKESYLRAFNADLPWPPSDELSEYKESKKLRNASRDWDRNVPVDRSHNRPVIDTKKKKEEKKTE
jgi:hypothetical protein